MRGEDFFLLDLIVVEESVGRLHFLAAIAAGGEFQGRLFAHRIEDDPKSSVEALVTEVGCGRFLENPFLHRTIRWRRPSGGLSGLCVVPGGEKLTRMFQTGNIT